jgi:5-methylthioribose kinase
LLELSTDTAKEYVAERLGVEPSAVEAWELAGGVSNVVMRVRVAGRADLVLKQSLGQLRTKEVWLCERERIFSEQAALELLAGVAKEGALPRILFADPGNYLIAMSAAEEGAPTWKEELLAGRVDLGLCRQAAELQGAFWKAGPGGEIFRDLSLFEQLRLDPYYRFTAGRHGDLERYFLAAVEQARERRVGLTHGDWSPKNFLVESGGRLFSIDYEVMHYGDPSFDVAFLLNHFLLKGWRAPQWRGLYAGGALAYWEALPKAWEWLEEGTIRHLGCLQLARVDGKSPVEYLSPLQQVQVRRFARDIIQNPPRRVAEIFEIQADAQHE